MAGCKLGAIGGFSYQNPNAAPSSWRKIKFWCKNSKYLACKRVGSRNRRYFYSIMEAHLEQILQEAKLIRQVNALIVAHLRDNNLNQAIFSPPSSLFTKKNSISFWCILALFISWILYFRLPPQLLPRRWRRWTLKRLQIGFLRLLQRWKVLSFLKEKVSFFNRIHYLIAEWYTGSCSGERWGGERNRFCCFLGYWYRFKCGIWVGYGSNQYNRFQVIIRYTPCLFVHFLATNFWLFSLFFLSKRKT